MKLKIVDRKATCECPEDFTGMQYVLEEILSMDKKKFCSAKAIAYHDSKEELQKLMNKLYMAEFMDKMSFSDQNSILTLFEEVKDMYDSTICPRNKFLEKYATQNEIPIEEVEENEDLLDEITEKICSKCPLNKDYEINDKESLNICYALSLKDPDGYDYDEEEY